MLLEKLKEYAHREDSSRNVLPPLYNMRPARYLIELDGEGRLLAEELTDTADPGERATRRGVLRPVPDVARAVGIKPLLLADKADYTLGYAVEGAKHDRVAAVHAAYLAQLDRCAEQTREPDVIAVQRFLLDAPLEYLTLDEKFDPSALITFRIDLSRFPSDLESVQAFWAAENIDPDAPVMQCIVCGQERSVLRRLQGKVKGIPGGQMAGTSIISANADAFESYGLEASLISPICASCGENFTKAANELLGSSSNRMTLGNAASIFWTREEVSFDFFSLIAAPSPEQVRELQLAFLKGGPAQEVAEVNFYATSLSASGGRAVVRDWIDTTVGEAQARLVEWFRLQKIVNRYGEDAQPLGLRDLASATVRELNDLPVPTSRELLRAALTGTRPQRDLLYQAVRRIRAEQSLTPPRTPTAFAHKRVALIKIVLASHRNWEGEYMVRLERDNTDPAYLCGRLFAVLEEAQRAALGNINASIVDRFFGTASSAPASVFGRLLRGTQAHLARLERDRPGAYIALQRRLEEVLSKLQQFPRTLTLEEQGLFSLGYYHQRADDRARASEARSRRDAGLLPETPGEVTVEEGGTGAA